VPEPYTGSALAATVPVQRGERVLLPQAGIASPELAAGLRARGARVAICARHNGLLEAAAEEIGAVPIVADVANEDDVLRMIGAVIKEYADYNVLINNAGFGAFAPLVDLTADDFFRVWQTNVLGAMLVAREAVHLLARRTHATGGLILLDCEGNPGFAFNTPRMAYGYVAPDGSFLTAV